MAFLVYRPVDFSLDVLVARATLCAMAVVQLVHSSLVHDAVAVQVIVAFATGKPTGEYLLIVFCVVMSLHVPSSIVCVVAVRVRTWNAAVVAHVR